jgi:hypothetical protein
MATAKKPPLIVPDGETQFVSDVGAPVEVAVRAVRAADLRPVSGVKVRFEVVSGPLVLGPRAARSTTVASAELGRAAVEARFTERGAAIVAADRVGGGGGETLFLGGQSDGMTHRVVVHLPAAPAAAAGEIPVVVTALDFHGAPVRGAKIALEANAGGDVWDPVRVKRGAPGEYTGTHATTRAGCRRFRAQDRATKVVGEACCEMTPGPPRALHVAGEPDPRREPPFGEAWLRAALEDEFGNGIDACRIECAVDGGELAATVRLRDEARFLVRRREGHGRAQVTLTDAGGSGLRASEQVHFAAAWVGDPGFVGLRDRFRTPLYLMPPADHPLEQATIRVAFDPARARFVGMSGADAVADRSTVVIEYVPRRPVVPRRTPKEIEIGEIEWACTDEGETCFEVTAEMSPVSEPWKLCVRQKRARQKCLCLNIIHRAGDLAALEAGDRAMRTVVSILSTKNIRRCCPSLRRELHHCRISAQDWRTKVIPAIGADGRVNSAADMTALFALNLCQRKKCINFLMIATDHSWADGASSKGPMAGSDRSFGVINPAYVDTVHNMGAHEVAHALGLAHLEKMEGDNVLSEFQPHGDNLTEDQCEAIFRGVDQYAC